MATTPAQATVAMAETPPGLTRLTTQGKKSFGADDEQYELDEVLGEGSYGSVYKCHRTRDNAVYAVKIIDPMRLGFIGGSPAIKCAESMALREVNALRKLSAHHGIISLQAAFCSPITQQIFIVTDFLPGSHLFSHVVQRTAPLQEEEVSHIMAQVSDAVSFCHSLGLVHRDLKLDNVLVANVNVRLVEERSPGGDVKKGVSWRSKELFTIKICDFGFAKALSGFTTRTPIGTSTYAAPEVDLDAAKERQGQGVHTAEIREDYDAFKADAYSVGVMMFVMLCLAFPVKDGNADSHRSHKLWPTLSVDARSLIDGLLEFDPIKRFNLVQVSQHAWVNAMECDSPRIAKRRRSKEAIVSEADRPWETSMRSPEPRWRCLEDPVLPGVLALQRALVHIQQERSMALWALAGAPALDGISSCWDQFQWHIELTQKRLHEAKDLLSDPNIFEHVRKLSDDTFLSLASNLTRGRQLSHSVSPLGSDSDSEFFRQVSEPSLTLFDSVFDAYSEACKVIIEQVARGVQSAKPGSSEGRRAARRYRLFSSAVEQLGKERAFICGHGRLNSRGLNSSPKNSTPAGLSRQMLQRLSEIIGSRKILLGTSIGSVSVSYTVATSTGLLGGMVGEAEPALLCTRDIAELEALEARVLDPNMSEALPIEEWYRTLTRLMNEIHSRIAIGLVDDMRAPALNLPPEMTLPESAFEMVDDFDDRSSPVKSFPAVMANISDKEQLPRLTSFPLFTEEDVRVAQVKVSESNSCGCRAGLKRWLQSLIDRM